MVTMVPGRVHITGFGLVGGRRGPRTHFRCIHICILVTAVTGTVTTVTAMPGGPQTVNFGKGHSVGINALIQRQISMMN